jgi:hypothetical protein
MNKAQKKQFLQIIIYIVQMPQITLAVEGKSETVISNTK